MNCVIDAPKFPPFKGFSWDEAKREANAVKHGIEMRTVEGFDFSTAVARVDNRADYGEVREIALGFIGTRLHVLVFARRPPLLQVISLRKANDRERKFYASQKT
jgi:uncharacterized protein